ncbi:2-deoxy-D-gluconate 3-dehydrogenase [Halanaerobium saccharolyticum]|uniref:2-deoxy-D-gluconate 3-dehydrogenase n=1 Tax=Halanaerobium saccharolyticum TaxID=43595 RepID=A0A4R7YNH3_9FIRM|nr:3-oxoacyl-ACP reductase FabG [Halanaerobium saccharolyticum]RAK04981.1 2-deoxy-D-gluconate 3-dehydrogenase [Halanaerobium saccharolyticum]TDV98335.1 2-deoxy-D-gluconate 3-dehydrogenase [Halanaerobium saccharolyticum]TDX51333.1 2-deoxy-D-gluconate 3-dehydrogenase [Halanaerobium saccharolyticum]
MKLFDLTGKKALVTGGSRGLGRGMAEGLLEAGAEVIITGVSDRVLETASELREQGHQVSGISFDLSNRGQIEKAFKEVLKKFDNQIDILVNNAGIQRRNKAEEFRQKDWDDVIEVNLNSVFRLSQLAAEQMLKNKGGKIINIASLLSFFGGYTVPAYAASKGGVAQLTKALSNEWAAKGINVNAVAPGYMDTDMNTALVNNEERNKLIMSRIPAGRWGKAEDMKGIAVFLASEASDYLSGAVIPVDGGYLGR